MTTTKAHEAIPVWDRLLFLDEAAALWQRASPRQPLTVVATHTARDFAQADGPGQGRRAAR